MNMSKFFLRTGVISLIAASMLIQTCMAEQGNDNKYTVAVSLKTAVTAKPDSQPPSAPGGIAVTYKTYTSVTLSWTKSLDNLEVKGYQVYRDGKKIISVKNTSYTNTSLIPGREYTYTVKAYDAAGNVSENSAAVNVTTISDTQPPSSPGALTCTIASYTSITLKWKPSIDNIGIKGYEIYLNGSKKAATSATSYVCKGLIPGKTYSFIIKAYDIAGNYSVQSNSISVGTTADTSAPSIPTGLRASSITETKVSLEWAASSDDVKVKGYEVFCDGAKVGITSDTSYNSKSLIPGKSHTYAVRALDTVGNMSGSSYSLKITALKDLEAPTAPTGLKVKSVNGSSVSLTWNASTDNIKVKCYVIYCNGIKIATTTRTSRTVKSPIGLGFDIYWVKAYDLVDNLSPGSNSVTVIIPC